MIFITPVDVTPSATGAYEDVDVSAHIPSGSTGVILHLVNSDTSLTTTLRLRKNGSTDDFNTTAASSSHAWACIGVDGSRIFEARVGSVAKIWLVGYFGSEAVFFTNAANKTLSGTGAWEDIDISGDTGGDTAIAAVMYIEDYTGDTWGLRKNGSTDSRVFNSDTPTGAIVGVDGSEILEGQVDDLGVTFHLVGYIKSGVVMNTNATDLSLGSTGSYVDLSSLPSGASGAIIEVTSNGGALAFALRKDGSLEDIYQDVDDDHAFAFVETASLILEGKIESTDVKFHLVGYFLSPGSSSVSPSLSPSSSDSLSPSPSRSLSPSASLSPSGSQSISPSASLSPSGSASKSLSPSASQSPSASASPSPRDYGLKVKKTSVNTDVEDITDLKELVFTSARGVLGLHSTDTVIASTDASGNINTTDNHSIGYVPIPIVTVTAYDGKRVTVPAEWRSFYQNGLSELIEVTEHFNFKIDSTKIRMIVHAEEYNHDTTASNNLASRSYTYKVYYYYNELVETF